MMSILPLAIHLLNICNATLIKISVFTLYFIWEDTLKYGFFEILVENPEAEGGAAPKRVDQYIFDELYNDGIVLQDPLLRKIYDHYGEMAEILLDPKDLQRSLVYSEDKEECQFAIENLEGEDYTYSPRWEKKYDMFTRYAENSILSLQQEVENTLLSLKLRVVEDELSDHVANSTMSWVTTQPSLHFRFFLCRVTGCTATLRVSSSTKNLWSEKGTKTFASWGSHLTHIIIRR